MQAIGRQPQRAPDGAALHYERHRPEQTTLYRLVQQHAASFIAHTEASTGALVKTSASGPIATAWRGPMGQGRCWSRGAAAQALWLTNGWLMAPTSAAP